MLVSRPCCFKLCCCRGMWCHACLGVQGSVDFELKVAVCHKSLFKRKVELFVLAVKGKLRLHVSKGC